MKTKTIFLSVATLLSLLISEKATAQIGEPYIHDPSTIMECEGKYYTFGTGGGGLISEDGWTWNSGGVRPGRGAAPDAVKIDCLQRHRRRSWGQSSRYGTYHVEQDIRP